MNAFALYRLPYADQYVSIEQLPDADGADARPLSFATIASLEGRRGFVLIPFASNGLHPVLLIRPDRVSTQPLPVATDEPASSVLDSFAASGQQLASPTSAYEQAFSAFHQALVQGRFAKLVLSRCHTVPYDTSTEVPQLPTASYMCALFHKACRAYPRMMVYLAFTGEEYWLGCTPEILLDGARSHYRTVALAGTMRADAFASPQQVEWDEKNRHEQAVVADYIRQQLQPCAEMIEEEGPYTSRAGQLLHLKSEFHFAPSQPFSVCHTIETLHPTPAVCGLPKAEAHRFILEHEGYDRSYYSGVVGMFDAEGETHLYVNLRCARFDEKAVHLYVGGGLLTASTLTKEWQETEAKMQTIASLL